MPFRLFVDSATGVDVEPEWDYERKDKKIEDRHRARSGAEFVYKWGEYIGIEFSVKFVNSSFQAIVNSWWNTNTDLLFMEVGGTEVFSVHIVNKDTPVGKVIKPYVDQFQGKIKLGGY